MFWVKGLLGMHKPKGVPDHPSPSNWAPTFNVDLNYIGSKWGCFDFRVRQTPACDLLHEVEIEIVRHSGQTLIEAYRAVCFKVHYRVSNRHVWNRETPQYH